jgi:flagellar motor switch protein FliM
MPNKNKTPKPEVEVSTGKTLEEQWNELLEEANDSSEGLPSDERCRGVLSQSELDFLLGFEDCGSREMSGLEGLINADPPRYKKLPIFEMIVSRFIKKLTTRIRDYTGTNIEISLDQLSNTRVSDYMSSIPLPAMLSVWKAKEWDRSGVYTIDSALIYSLVDVLLGGINGTAAMRIEGRPYTKLESRIIEDFSSIVSEELAAGFNLVTPLVIQHTSIETNPRFVNIAASREIGICAKLRFDMEDRGGRMEIFIPHSTLEPVWDIITEQYYGEQMCGDVIWSEHFASEIVKSSIGVEIILPVDNITLYDALQWKIGQKITIGKKTKLSMRVENHQIGECSITNSTSAVISMNTQRDGRVEKTNSPVDVIIDSIFENKG